MCFGVVKNDSRNYRIVPVLNVSVEGYEIIVYIRNLESVMIFRVCEVF